MTRKLAELDNALVEYSSLLSLGESDRGEEWKTAYLGKSKAWSAASTAFVEAKHLTALVCGTETRGALGNYHKIANEIAHGIIEKDAGAYGRLHDQLNTSFLLARAAIRRELDIDKSA